MVTYHFSSESPLAKLFMILFIVVIGAMVAYVLFRWLKDRSSPRITTMAEIISKETNKVRHRSKREAGIGRRTTYSNEYYVTFQLAHGDTLKLFIRIEAEYERLQEGDKGKLTYQGKRYIGFEKENPSAKGDAE